MQVPVVKTDQALQFLEATKTNFIDEQKAISILAKQEAKLYTNSENTLDWIYRNHPDKAFIAVLEQVKNKIAMRHKLKQVHPGYAYREVLLMDLARINPNEISYPVILKPSVGFFSLGVHAVKSSEEWIKAVHDIMASIDEIAQLYPEAVLDLESFIVEEVIEGDEYAADCYYDEKGELVVLNIMKHLFASAADVNDRVYVTSSAIIADQLPSIQKYLEVLGGIFGFKNFPAHIELRIDKGSSINVVEINPLRFGGWCSTPDLAHHAWGFNVYHQFCAGERPVWDKLTDNNSKNTYALIVLNNSTGIPGSKIRSFNYKHLMGDLDNPLELREVDHKAYPLFGFIMCMVPSGDLSSLHKLLHSDLSEYVEV